MSSSDEIKKPVGDLRKWVFSSMPQSRDNIHVRLTDRDFLRALDESRNKPPASNDNHQEDKR